MFSNFQGNKSNIYERGWLKFDREHFVFDNFIWDESLKIDELNANNLTQMLQDKINMLLNNYAPCKRINKYNLKFKSNLDNLRLTEINICKKLII